jgi:predicted phosphodiesterase
MRLHILSDLHLEFGTVRIPKTDADVVVLAGDIHLGREGRKWARRHFADKHVVYVLGNHEFYRHSIPALTENLKRETDGSQIHVLENQAFQLDGLTFLGCTLWTDFKLVDDCETAMRVAEDTISDYSIIDFEPESQVLRAKDTLRLHEESLVWLKSELAKHDPTRTVVVTHHGPSARSIPSHHAGSPLNPAFVSKLDLLVETSDVPLWIHGHTHHNVDYKIGSTRVLSNQRGYPDEKVDEFEPGLVVEI